MRRSIPAVPLQTIVLALGLVGVVGCAPDPLDTYSADAPPATRGDLPTVSLADDNSATFDANGEAIDVRALDNSFITETIEIEAGTEVHWFNGGRNDHNVLPVDESLAWGVERDAFEPGADYSHLFDQPGVYEYYCSIHGTKDAGMIGAVVVAAPG